MRMWRTIQRWETSQSAGPAPARHQGDDSFAELQIKNRHHKHQKRNVEISASDPRVKATASSSGTRKSRILAFTVSSRTIAQLNSSSFPSSQQIPQPRQIRTTSAAGQTPEAVDQQRHQHKLLD